MFDLSWEKPEPLVPRRHRLEVGERMGADGRPVSDLPEDDVIAAADAADMAMVFTGTRHFRH